MSNATRLIARTALLDRLASLPRTGWLLRGVTDPESIAEHSFGVCVVAAALVDDLRERGLGVDGERVLRMALLHDAAEVFTGDVPMPAKSAALAAALHAVEERLLAEELSPAELALWREAQAGASLEARVVKAADKVQMLVKALVYTRERRGRLAEFWENHANRRDMGLELAREVFVELEALAAAEPR
ncbi:MAG: HD family hydrolase [Polyangiaceae bacterium]|nr:HD family hydrolase [Polyangiaceae bacterium]